MHTIINNLNARFVHGKDETEYFEEIVSHVNTKNPQTFVFSVWDKPLGTIPEGSIVFSTSDEHHQQPIQDHLRKEVSLVFKNYYPKDGTSDPRVFPLPLGYLTGFSGTDSISVTERELDYSFSGTFNSNGRDKMLHQLNARSQDGRKKFFRTTEGWGRGLSMNEYSHLLSNTKIALCPSGYVSKESFRIFEAARCGCVLLVDDIPLNQWYYDQFPGIVIKDWSDLSVIERLLNDLDTLQELSKRTKVWYDQHVSPKSVGKYIEKVIKDLHHED